MEADLQRRVQRYGWDKARDLYDRFWASQLKPAQDLLIALADLKEGESLIDTACGTGLVTFPVADLVGPEGSVMATDLSGKMIDEIQERAHKKGASNITAERMDAEELELPDHTYDVALSCLGIMYYPDPLRAMEELYRVLKPGGRAVVATWGRRDRCGWADIFPIVDSRVNTDVCPMFFSQGTGDTLLSTLTGAGFSKVSVERIETILEYPDFDSACGAAFAGGPVAMAYSRFDETTKEEAHQEYRESIETFRSSDGYQIPGEFVLAVARKEEQAS